MKKRYVSLVAVLIIIFMLLSMGACASKSKLAGEWKRSGGEDLYYFWSEDIEFLSNGTVYGDGNDVKGEWSVNGDTLTVKTDSRDYTYTFNISDNKLTLTDEVGDTATYNKKG